MKRLKDIFFILTDCLLTLTVWISCNDNKQVDSGERYEYFTRILPGCNESQPFMEFHQWLLTDLGSMPCLIDLECQGILQNVAVSSDYRLAEIQWVDNENVTHSLVQVRTEEGFKAYPGTLLDFEAIEPRPDEVVTRDIRLFAHNDDTLYMAVSKTGEYTSLYGNPIYEISAYRISSDTLYRMDNFFVGEHADSTATFLRFSYNPKDWSIRNAIHGIGVGYSLDNAHNQLLIPVTDMEERALDKYHLYILKEDLYSCYQNTIVDSPQVGPSLAGYKALEQQYYADGMYIRIDLMPDGTYRYASWYEYNMPNRYVQQYFPPEVIIYGGKLVGQYYTFRRGTYTYRVPTINDCYSTDAGRPVKPEVVINQDGHIIDTFPIMGVPY